MINPYLTNNAQYFDDINSRFEKVHPISNEAWFDVVVEGIKDWLLKLSIKSDSEGLGDSSLIEELEIYSRGNLPGSIIAENTSEDYIPESVNNFFRGKNTNDEAEYICGKAIALVIIENINTSYMVLTYWMLLRHYNLAWKVCHDNLESRLNKNLSEQLYETLRDIYKSEKNNITNRLYRDERDRYESAIKEYKSNIHFFSIIEWEQYYGTFFYSSDNIEIFDLLRNVNTLRYIDLLQDLEIPMVINWLLFRQEVQNSITEQIRLIDHCREIKDIDELNRSPHLICLISICVSSLERINLHKDSKYDEDVKPHILSFVDALSRLDSSGLISFFLSTHLIAKDQKRHKSSDDLEKNVKFEIIAEMSKKYAANSLNTWKGFLEIICSLSKSNSVRNDLTLFGFYAVVLMMIDDEKLPADLIRSLTKLYNSILNDVDSGFRNSFSSQYLGYVDYHCGLFLAQNESPSNVWLDIWFSFENVRRETNFYSYTKKIRSSSPDLTHAYVGLAELEWLLAGEYENIKEARLLFIMLLKIAIEQTEGSIQNEWEIFIVSLFARVGYLIPLCGQQRDYRFLISALHWVENNYELLAGVLNSLFINDVEISELVKSYPQGNLIDKLQDYIEWSQRDGGKLSRISFVSEAQRLVSKIV